MLKRIKALAKKVARFIYRSAITGRFVSEAHAKANPKQTVKERKRG